MNQSLMEENENEKMECVWIRSGSRFFKFDCNNNVATGNKCTGDDTGRSTRNASAGNRSTGNQSN